MTRVTQLIGEQIDNAATSFSAGIIQSGRSGIKLIGNVVLGDSEKLMDVLQLFLMRRTVVKAFYPTLEVEERLKKNPEDLVAKVIFFELQERQFHFSMRLIRLLSLTPFSRKMSDKRAEIIEQEHEIGQARKFRDGELQILREKIASQIDIYLVEDAEEDEKQLAEAVEMLERCNLLLKDDASFLQWQEVGREIISDDLWSHIYGRYLMQSSQYENAIKFLEQAYMKGVIYAEDDLLECIDNCLKNCPAEQQEQYRKKREKIAPLFVGVNNLDRLKNLPISFLLVKKYEISKILKWGKDD